jgi:hypothetical protein
MTTEAPVRELQVAVAHPVTPEQLSELARCAMSVTYFRRYWRYICRETGEEKSFATIWPGQQKLEDAAEEDDHVAALKAGKNGFTEWECMYDGWVARFRSRNARVHLFSMDAASAKEMLRIVKYGLRHLPEWMQLPVLDDTEDVQAYADLLGVPRKLLQPELAGASGATSLKLVAGVDDIRTIVSYPAGPDVSIDASAQHTHVDELARMRFPESTWAAIRSTVEHGTCHIISRGKGQANYYATLFTKLMEGGSRMKALFVGWRGRPDRDDAWYEQQKRDYSPSQLRQFAPANIAEALSGGEALRFNFDQDVHVIEPYEIPEAWPRYTGTDYGFTATKVSPWYTGFITRSAEGTWILFDEDYGAEVPASQQAQRIVAKMDGRRFSGHFAGPDVFQQKRADAGTAVYQVAKDYEAQGIHLEAANNDRIQGWALFDKLLAYTRLGDRIVELPRFQVMSNCKEFLRTFPALLADERRPEDADTEGEDDPPDGVRYGLMGALTRMRGALRRQRLPGGRVLGVRR